MGSRLVDIHRDFGPVQGGRLQPSGTAGSMDATGLFAFASFNDQSSSIGIDADGAGLFFEQSFTGATGGWRPAAILSNFDVRPRLIVQFEPIDDADVNMFIGFQNTLLYQVVADPPFAHIGLQFNSTRDGNGGTWRTSRKDTNAGAQVLEDTGVDVLPGAGSAVRVLVIDRTSDAELVFSLMDRKLETVFFEKTYTTDIPDADQGWAPQSAIQRITGGSRQFRTFFAALSLRGSP